VTVTLGDSHLLLIDIDEEACMAEKDVIRTDRAPGPFQGAPYNQAIRVGDLVFVAGQLGIVLESGELAGPTVEEQTEQIMRNLSAILEAASSGLDKLVKTTVFLLDLADFAGMNEVYARHVGDRPPARSTIGIAQLPSGARVEIEAIAHV
jgi:2-iminobutanoate/2-iminopropanoate deaminase